MKENHIQINKTARYFTSGKDEDAEQIWFVLHGYGHLADKFLKRFQILTETKNLIVAPEGLHRFYLNGSSGKVGASWMTKEDRLSDMKDYVNYLDLLYDQYQSKVSDQIKINVLGFSQGVATASRWIEQGEVKANNLILWAGVFPLDMSFQISKDKLTDTNIYMVIGNDDKYIKLEEIEKQKELLDRHGVKYKVLNFEGKHEIDQATLLALSKLITTAH